jgi:3-deoxy-D-manno-octulosonic-acid transferase
MWIKNTQIAPQDLLLLDTVGDLANLYQVGELAFVGGGWSGRGGHNPLEPLRYGVRTIMGPHFDNFKDLVVPLLGTESLWTVPAEQLQAQLDSLSAPPLKDFDPALQTALKEFGKALDQTWQSLEPRI